MKEKSKKIQTLINEAVSEALLEFEYDGIDVGDYDYGTADSSSHSSSKNSVAGMFLNPFYDVVKTGLWGIKTLSAKMIFTVKALAQTLFIGLTPRFYTNFYNHHKPRSVWHEFNKVSSEEMKVLSGINKQYSDVLKRNWDALLSNDAWGIAFLLNPGMLIAGKLIEKTPKVGFEIMNSLTGGWAERQYNLLKEDNKINKENLIKKINQSAGGIELQKAGIEIMKRRIEKILSINTLEEFAKATNEKVLKTFEILTKSIKNNNEILNQKNIFLKELKKSFINQYIKDLQSNNLILENEKNILISFLKSFNI